MLKSVLSHPLFYLGFQGLIGGINARRVCIRDYVNRQAGLTVLDIGCGPGYCIQYFQSPRYFGFDVSPEYIRYARNKYSTYGEFFCGLFDEQSVANLPPVDVVIMMGLLHHLNDNEAEGLLSLTKRTMKPGAQLVALEGCYRPGQSRLAKYFLDQDRGRFVRDQEGYVRIASQVFQDVRTNIREDLFYIPYTKLIIECRS